MKFLTIAKDWIISIALTSILVFGTIWTFADPIGFKQGWELFFTLLGLSIAISTIIALIKSLQAAFSKIKNLEKLLSENKDKLTEAQEKISYCSALGQKSPCCPLGVTAIYPQMESTIITTIKEAHHSFKWLGLSAFNVLHKNKEYFLQKKDVNFEFFIANPENDNLAIEVDKFFGDVKGRLGAKKLISESNSLISDFIENVNPNIRLIYHNQMPSFRIIIVDDKKAFVSFYERGIDALKSVQIEVTDNPDLPFSIFKWFTMYYQKFLITEQLITPK